MKLKGFALTFLLCIVLFSFLFFLWTRGRPKIQVTPEKAPLDVPVQITISNLAAHEQVTIEAYLKVKDDLILSSHAAFEADKNGRVNVTSQAPNSGSYHGIDPMGLFWSMTPTDKTITTMPLNKEEVVLNVFSKNKLLTQKKIYRLHVSPDVEKKEIREQGIVGTLFYPKNMKSGPGIIVVTGSSGGIPITISQLLASHGYTVLALAYFQTEGLPDKLENIPLEYFQNALLWFKKQPQVDRTRIALWGISYGGELILLLGSMFPEKMSAIVAYVPSSYVYGGIPEFNKPAWTYKNQPISFMPSPTTEEILNAVKEGKVPFHKGTVEDPHEPALLYLYGLQKFSESIEKSTIPVENIHCPILIFSGEDDKMWPSTLYGNRIMERLDQKRSTIERKHIHFPSAGHYFEIPYAPSICQPYYHPVVKFWCAMGGTAEGNARASSQSWQEALSFLKENLL